MSMMRLLAAGKSLAGLKNSVARYRMTDPRALPKFGPANNPFHTKSTPEPVPVVRLTSRLPIVGQASRLPQGPLAPVDQQTVEKIPTAPPTNAGETLPQSRDATPASLPQTQRRGLSKMLSGLFERRVLPARSSIPKRARQSIQGELTLENVRVVRNDLSDTDLEIVAAKTAAAPKPAAQSSGIKPVLEGACKT